MTSDAKAVGPLPETVVWPDSEGWFVHDGLRVLHPECSICFTTADVTVNNTFYCLRHLRTHTRYGNSTVMPTVGAVTYADEDGDFPLTGGGFGNPGCDDCGSGDAVARFNGKYYCESGAKAVGIPVPDRLSAEQVDVWCRFCNKNAGHGHHIGGVFPPNENNVVCDNCWDPRLA